MGLGDEFVRHMEELSSVKDYIFQFNRMDDHEVVFIGFHKKLCGCCSEQFFDNIANYLMELHDCSVGIRYMARNEDNEDQFQKFFEFWKRFDIEVESFNYIRFDYRTNPPIIEGEPSEEAST